MDQLSWLHRLGTRRSDSAVAGAPIDPAHPLEGDEEQLHARLALDPNDRAAWYALAILLRDRLDGDASFRRALGATAGALGRAQKAWLPLVIEAQVDLASQDGEEDSTQRALGALETALERETTGVALRFALGMLRDTQHRRTALELGIQHWEGAARHVDCGEEIVLSALELGDVAEARRLVTRLGQSSGSYEVAEIARLVDAAERAEQPQG